MSIVDIVRKSDNKFVVLLKKYYRIVCGTYTYDSEKYWETRYRTNGNSGSGSYNELAQYKAEFINSFIKKNGVKTILDLGCGDGNQLTLGDYQYYTGVDVSQTIIESNRIKFKDDKTKKFYTTNEFELIQKQICDYDLVLSCDVIYHLIEDAVFDHYLENLFFYSKGFIIIYSSNFNEYDKGTHIRHRKFSDIVSQKYPGWELILFNKNPYAYDENNPDYTSLADFYVYKFIEMNNNRIN